jgi:hypothetical protein
MQFACRKTPSPSSANAGQVKHVKPRSTMEIAKFENAATAPGSVESGSYIVQAAKPPKDSQTTETDHQTPATLAPI